GGRRRRGNAGALVDDGDGALVGRLADVGRRGRRRQAVVELLDPEFGLPLPDRDTAVGVDFVDRQLGALEDRLGDEWLRGKRGVDDDRGALVRRWAGRAPAARRAGGDEGGGGEQRGGSTGTLRQYTGHYG